MLVDLQKYIIEIDKYNLNIISQDYREKYFEFIDCEYVQVDVFAYNEHAKKFYLKNGYEDRMVTVFKKS